MAELQKHMSLNANISGDSLVEPAEVDTGVTHAAVIKPRVSLFERVCSVRSILECHLAENPKVAQL